MCNKFFCILLLISIQQFINLLYFFSDRHEFLYQMKFLFVAFQCLGTSLYQIMYTLSADSFLSCDLAE